MKLGNKDVKIFTEYLCNNKKFKEIKLDLSCNTINNETAEDIADAMYKNKELEVFHLKVS